VIANFSEFIDMKEDSYGSYWYQLSFSLIQITLWGRLWSTTGIDLFFSRRCGKLL